MWKEASRGPTMAKASRSSKKQPDFDPTELSDLIYTPAVGSGVGSHLLEPELSTVEQFHQATVDPVAIVDMSHMSTEEVPEMSTVEDSSTVDEIKEATVDISNHAVVVWITEQGEVVPKGRVRRIGVAKDVINPAEESVYETLLAADSVSPNSASEEPFRVVEAGYDYLAKRTHLSKRTIQRIVEKLIDKDFIAIERPADIYRRSSTVYRVFSEKKVLEHHLQKGRLHVAKLGPGYCYVRRLGEGTPL